MRHVELGDFNNEIKIILVAIKVKNISVKIESVITCFCENAGLEFVSNLEGFTCSLVGRLSVAVGLANGLEDQGQHEFASQLLTIGE